jgi:hypothetical protein
MRPRSIIHGMSFALGLPVALAVSLSACSPSAPPAPGHSAPATAELGSSAWQRWVGQTLSLDDPGQGGPSPGSDAWNAAVQRRLGQEAPSYPPGSPQWQQAVDGLLRTRAAGAP